jgi:hypothetical protein
MWFIHHHEDFLTGRSLFGRSRKEKTQEFMQFLWQIRSFVILDVASISCVVETHFVPLEILNLTTEII